MKENVRVDFVNEESANQFRTIVWRTTQKRDFTTQKADETTTQKAATTTQKAILDFFRDYPKASKADAAHFIGDITEDGVKFILGGISDEGSVTHAQKFNGKVELSIK